MSEKSKRWPFWLLGFLAAFFLTIVSYPLWLPFLGRWLVVTDSLTAADAVVPLGGEGIRVGYAAELLAEGYGSWFVATNAAIDMPGIDEPYVKLVRSEAQQSGVPAEQIIELPTLVRTTSEEALVVRRAAEEFGWESVLVVTSPYHTRRSRQIFSEVFRDSPVVVRVVPVSPHWYDGSGWWQDVSGVQVTIMEYLKFLAHWTGYH